MAEQTASGYIQHHLQNLTFGQLPNGDWGFAHTAQEAKEMGFPISEESLHALAADRGLTVMDFATEMKKVEEDRKAAQKRKEDAMKMESELAPKPAPGAPAPAKPAAKPASKPDDSGNKE